MKFTVPGTALSSGTSLLFGIWGLYFNGGTQLVPDRGPISWRQMAYNQVEVVPRKALGSLAGYFQNRSAMARSIQRRDLKTLEHKIVSPMPAQTKLN